MQTDQAESTSQQTAGWRAIFRSNWLLVALIASSALAYTWPRLGIPQDPFSLPRWGLWALVSVTMFCLGLVVKSEELRELRERPLAVLLGVALQCTVMPLLAWLAVRCLGLEGETALGVILVGCVPGAMASNVLTLTARGNVSYSISLTTVATLLSPLTVPTALYLTGGLTLEDGGSSLVQSSLILLGLVVIPVVVGFVASQAFPTIRATTEWVAPWVASVALLWIIASVVAGNRERLVLIESSMVVALLTINVLGYAAGYGLGRRFGLTEPMGRALALEVGMQNAGIGTALAATLFGAGTVAQIPTAAYTFGCMLTGTILASYWAARPSKN